MPAESRENPLLKKGNSDAFFKEKYLTKNKKALDELRYYKMNDQICVINQDVLDKKLFYQKAYQVNQNEK